MRSLWIHFIFVSALIVACNYPSIAQTPEQLYQKGLMKEGDGELQDAISIYYQIADNSNTEQSFRAKALLHIGMCYERMEPHEAVIVYQCLINIFPSQKNEIAIAWERLNRLTWKQPNPDRFRTASFKGRSPANLFWGKEDAAIHHLINGETLILNGRTQPILHSVLQFLKMSGISLIVGGILIILVIYILIMLIIQLRISYTKKRDWKFII